MISGVHSMKAGRYDHFGFLGMEVGALFAQGEQEKQRIRLDSREILQRWRTKNVADF